jgi:predicted metal-dependent peptidase
MDWTPDQLQRELDRMKSEIFLRKGEAVLAQLLCSIPVIWAEDAVTAYTNSMVVAMNPKFVLNLPSKTRPTVLAHELWHIGMLDILRGQGKEWEPWNWATDYRHNAYLQSKGYSFDGTKPFLDMRYFGLAAEEIYDDLLLRRDNGTLDNLGAMWGITDDNGMFDVTDLKHPTADDERYETIPPLDANQAAKLVNTVVQATQYAAQSPAGGGDNSSEIDFINQFLQPKVRWEKEILPFMTAAEGLDYDWRIPNRRIRYTYLPSLRTNSEGGLTHIAFFGDSSGSITKSQLVRINSEARYVWKRFNPALFTMINFDDEIEMVKQMRRGDSFEEMEVVGRGGTDLRPVRQWIIDNKPKAVVIFSDLDCTAMEPLEPKDMVPILWIVFNNPNATIPHGRRVDINE